MVRLARTSLDVINRLDTGWGRTLLMWSVASHVSDILTTDLARGLDGREVLNGSDGTQGTRGAAEASHSNELLRVSSSEITFGRVWSSDEPLAGRAGWC